MESWWPRCGSPTSEKNVGTAQPFVRMHVEQTYGGRERERERDGEREREREGERERERERYIYIYICICIEGEDTRYFNLLPLAITSLAHDKDKYKP